MYVAADYASVEAVKRHLSSTFTEEIDDLLLAELVREASDMFARNTRRTFVPYAASHTVIADAESYEELFIPDFLAISSVTQDGAAVAAETFETRPLDEYPIKSLVRLSGYWAAGARVVVAGTGGYHPDPLAMWKTVPANLGEAIDDSVESFSLSSVDTAGLETLDYIRIDSEVMQITGIVPGEDLPDPDPDVHTVLTVERGALRTTAATHADGSGIARYRQYELVRRACILRAAHLYVTRANPGGERVNGPQGSFLISPQETKIILQTERQLKRTTVMGELFG